MFGYQLMIFGFCVGVVTASSVEELKQRYAEVVMKCATEYPVTAQEVEVLKMKQIPESSNVKCLLACFYKKTGMMDAQGLLSVEGIHAISKDIFAEDATKMQKSIQFTEVCREVNYQYVTDGSEGCDRAALIFKCTVEKAPDFDFVV